MFGFFSQKSVDQGHQTCIYGTPDGREFEITQVSDSPDHGTAWDDMIALGEVGRYKRVGRNESRSRQILEQYPPMVGKLTVPLPEAEEFFAKKLPPELKAKFEDLPQIEMSSTLKASLAKFYAAQVAEVKATDVVEADEPVIVIMEPK